MSRENEIVSFSEDEWIRDQYFHKPRLIIRLNTSELIYSDDDRPEREEPSFWKRMKLFMSERRQLRIEEIQLQFRSNLISPLPKKARAYFFRKALHAHMNGPVLDYFVVGYVNTDLILKTEKYMLPALLLEEKQDRDPKDYEDSLIWN